MQLENYISELLYRYDCVIVPSFGAFLSNSTSAKVHQSTHTFYPPKKELSFNEQLLSNDGLLASYIAEVEKIPYAAATDKILNQVAVIKSYLVEGERVKLDNIGDLILNTEGKIVFTPLFHINYLTDAFGLSHFTLNDEITNREVYKETVNTLETIAPIAITEEKRTNINWFKYAAVAVLFLGLSGLASVFYNTSVVNHNLIAAQEANTQLHAKVQEATFVINNLPAVTLALEKQNGSYHIVAGAFSIELNANEKVKQLQKKGFNAKNIGKNTNNLFVVIYGSFNTKADAERELKLIKKDYNKDAWIYIKQL